MPAIVCHANSMWLVYCGSGFSREGFGKPCFAAKAAPTINCSYLNGLWAALRSLRRLPAIAGMARSYSRGVNGPILPALAGLGG